MSHQIRKRYYFSGRVQGVGFRYQTNRIASGHAVFGFVRNLSDGRVELVAEGTSGEIERFVREIQKAMGDYIRDTVCDKLKANGEFSSFEIRH